MISSKLIYAYTVTPCRPERQAEKKTQTNSGTVPSTKSRYLITKSKQQIISQKFEND